MAIHQVIFKRYEQQHFYYIHPFFSHTKIYFININYELFMGYDYYYFFLLRYEERKGYENKRRKDNHIHALCFFAFPLL